MNSYPKMTPAERLPPPGQRGFEGSLRADGDSDGIDQLVQFIDQQAILMKRAKEFAGQDHAEEDVAAFELILIAKAKQLARTVQTQPDAEPRADCAAELLTSLLMRIDERRGEHGQGLLGVLSASMHEETLASLLKETAGETQPEQFTTLEHVYGGVYTELIDRAI